MNVYLPGSVAVARTKIFKMASGSHFEYSFSFIKSSFIMTFGKNFPIQVPDDSVFANFSNFLEE